MAENWVDFPIPDGSYSDPTRPWSHQDLVNYLPMQAEMAGARSGVLLRTAPGLKLIATLGTGPIRGIRDVEGTRFIVSGTKLYRLNADGSSDELGTIPGTGPVPMTHNQVAGGNQLVVGNGSSGYIYDTRDDSLINPTQPEDEPGDNPTSPGGGTPSTELGPNGGFPDDAPYPIPLPAEFDDDVIGGAFDLNDWRSRYGNPLPTSFADDDGELTFEGASGEAYGYKWRMSLPANPLPRYSVTVTMDVQTSSDQTVRVGVAWGTNGSGGELPNYVEASDAAVYVEETTVTHTWLMSRPAFNVTANGAYVINNFVPYVGFNNELGLPSIGIAKNPSMVITEVPIATSLVTIEDMDLESDGLSNIELWPDPTGINPHVPEVIVVEGALVMSPHYSSGTFRNAYWLDEISEATEVGQYVTITAEVWCNDPSVDFRGLTTGGAAMYLAPKSGVDGFLKNSLFVGQRGDWTIRKWVYRVNAVDPAITWHIAAQMKCAPGYQVKVRVTAVEISDEAVD